MSSNRPKMNFPKSEREAGITSRVTTQLGADPAILLKDRFWHEDEVSLALSRLSTPPFAEILWNELSHLKEQFALDQ